MDNSNRNKRQGGLLLLIIFLGLVACEPEPTPFPVDVPLAETAVLTPPPAATIEAISEAAAPGVIRYALAANTAGLVADLPLLTAAAQVETLTEPVNPADLGQRYDLIAAYGDLPGGTRSPVTPHVALLINSAAPPLNQPDIAAVIRRSLNPGLMLEMLNLPGAVPEPAESITQSALRTELANAGWPDGFDLTIAVTDAPGVDTLAAQLQPLGIQLQTTTTTLDQLQTAFAAGKLHLVLATWRTPDERAAWVEQVGENNLIDLYTVPISYLTVLGLNVTFSPAGWPIPQP